MTNFPLTRRRRRQSDCIVSWKKTTHLIFKEPSRSTKWRAVVWMFLVLSIKYKAKTITYKFEWDSTWSENWNRESGFGFGFDPFGSFGCGGCEALGTPVSISFGETASATDFGASFLFQLFQSLVHTKVTSIPKPLCFFTFFFLELILSNTL